LNSFSKACARPEFPNSDRRPAAILAVDVVGASRLMGEDEAGTAKAGRERREAAHPMTLNANYGLPPIATLQ
jgi:class 3 adenylate cyclase